MSKTQLFINQGQDISTQGSLSTAYKSLLVVPVLMCAKYGERKGKGSRKFVEFTVLRCIVNSESCEEQTLTKPLYIM